MNQIIQSFADIARSGFKTTSLQEYEKRKSICLGCSFWDDVAWGGLGKCNKCGCSGVKLKMAASKCPIGLWIDEIDI
jgi:hypothetical protein